eukprot:snap_masked-scaffold_6-processed-gene-16.51-mRNA-1 protein AED:1.00 eAED:1.00 QI:0/-1/0/0/-1/1/1/0/79
MDNYFGYTNLRQDFGDVASNPVKISVIINFAFSHLAKISTSWTLLMERSNGTTIQRGFKVSRQQPQLEERYKVVPNTKK